MIIKSIFFQFYYDVGVAQLCEEDLFFSIRSNTAVFADAFFLSESETVDESEH